MCFYDWVSFSGRKAYLESFGDIYAKQFRIQSFHTLVFKSWFIVVLTLLDNLSLLSHTDFLLRQLRNI